MSGTRHAVVARRPLKPLAVSVVAAFYGTTGLGSLAAAGSLLVMVDWEANPPNLALGAGLLIATLIAFGLYAFVIATANLTARRWAWSAAVLTSVVLCILAALSILPLMVFILQARWHGPGVWETEGLPLQLAGLGASIVALATLIPAVKSYHREPVRDYFGGV